MPADAITGIQISRARTHNLQAISLTIPHDRLTVLTGPSGCGKSSLAIDTIFAESQRQFLETLSLYARQFLHQLPRPDVDSIEGLLPSLRVDQLASSNSTRSTVGTLTEILDYLRVLYARVGVLLCPNCHQPVSQQSSDQIARWILQLPEQTKVVLLAPLVRGRRGKHDDVLDRVRAERLVRVRVDGQIFDIEQVPELNPRREHHVEAVTDRIVVRPGIESRLRESLDLSIRLSGGTVIISWPATDSAAPWQERFFSTRFACPQCERSFAELEPRSFSFNSPYGACPRCEGLGQSERFKPERVFSDPTRTLSEGAISCWNVLPKSQRQRKLDELGPLIAAAGIDRCLPIASWAAAEQEHFWQGTSKPDVPGLSARLESDLQATESDEYFQSLSECREIAICPSCHGSRLNEAAQSVLVGGYSIAQLSAMSLSQCRDLLARELQLSAEQSTIAAPLLQEVRNRLDYLCRVGLDYLSLDRPVHSLSGGEHQRVRLASSIGAGLTNVCFVLDEPSMGLHARDTVRLIELLGQLRDAGNTILVVEHDEAIMRGADWLVDLGPGAGSQGGQIVDQGPPLEVVERGLGKTGRFLRRTSDAGSPPATSPQAPRLFSPPGDRRRAEGWLRIRQATLRNLLGLDVDLPLNVLVSVAGVSGSGKSTLVHEILVPLVRQHLGLTSVIPDRGAQLSGAETIARLVVVDQRPIGRTPRGCPATYCGVFDELRKTFAATRLAKQLGFSPQRFSFNSPAGWCPECRGHGQRRIEMKFLPDFYVTCGLCQGDRFNPQTLQVRFRDRTLADVLRMSVDTALAEFGNLPAIASRLESLQAVGLGYVSLGQPSTTLSGGEAQRIKLAAELLQNQSGSTLYVLDEPTTGLHFDDVTRLMQVLQRLVQNGNSVLVIEHHLELLAASDWLIDLGPEGGPAGGKVVAAGTPEQVARNEASLTGRFLRPALGLPASFDKMK